MTSLASSPAPSRRCRKEQQTLDRRCHKDRPPPPRNLLPRSLGDPEGDAEEATIRDRRWRECKVPRVSPRTEPQGACSGRLCWKEGEGSPYGIVTLGFGGMWGLGAVGLHQPQVPRQEEELQELRDRSAGPMLGKSQCQPQALPAPSPTATSHSALPLFQRPVSLLWKLRTLALSHCQLQPQKFWSLHFPHSTPPTFLLKGPSLHLPFSALTRWRRYTPSWITSWAAARSASR